MAKRWLIGGLAVGVGALAVAPEARIWLRRRLGLEAEDRRWFEDEGTETAEYEGDEPLDTRESRFSLRARLSEDAPHEAEAPSAPEAFAAPEAIDSVDAPMPESTPDQAAQPWAAEAQPWAAEAQPWAAEAAQEPESEPAPPAAVTWDSSPFAAVAVPEPAEHEPEAEAEPEAAEAEPEPEAEPPSLEPESTPFSLAAAEPEPEPSLEPESTPFSPPARDTGYPPLESLPSIVPEADAPKTPGEDTDEVGLPAANTWESPAEPPLPPPTELRPPPPPPSRPFSSEGASFRSAIDAARERVHGAAREATPDEGDSEPTDKDD